MSLFIEQKYVYCKAGRTIEEFEIHYGNLEEDDAPFTPCFEVQIEKKEGEVVQTLLPGYKDIEGNYYKFPVRIFFVQIDFIKIVLKQENSWSYETTLEVDLRVYNKDFKSFNKFHLMQKRGTGQVLGFMFLQPIVRFINRYIAVGRDIRKLDFAKLSKKSSFQEDKKVIQTVSNLKFKFFSNSRSNVGKDNSFWEEGEVYDLPMGDVYLLSLFQKYFNEAFDRCGMRSDDTLLFTFDHDRAWAPSTPRTEYANKQLEERIKLELGNYLGKNYSKVEHEMEYYSIVV